MCCLEQPGTSQCWHRAPWQLAQRGPQQRHPPPNPHTLDSHCNWLHTRSPPHPQASQSLTDSLTDPLTACTPSLTAVSVWRTCPSQCTLRLSSVRFSRSSSLLTAPLLGGKPGRRRPGES